MKNIIIQCLEYDPNLRPSFQNIHDAINSTVMLIQNEDTSVYWEYINKISDFEEKLSDQLLDIKREADKGDPSMMYLYANARLHGDECAINKIEALKYLKMASEQGHKDSARTLRELSIERNSIPDQFTNCDSQILQDTQAKPNQTFNNEGMLNDDNSSLLSLYIDPYFKTEKLDFESVIQSVKENIRRVEIKEFPKVEETNFIFSEGAVDRLTKLSYYIECGVPVLLEEPTGTSKTLSTEIVCSLLGKRLERFNLSSETKAADLLGRYSGDESSWAGITHIDGPFVKAFRDGYCLLLDEINLASENVLQCIQESLDSGFISIEIPGMPLQEIKMNEGAKGDNKFCLVATQNPNKGLFAHKRQDLGLKLLSRFQVINFPSFEKVELLTIAEGLSQRFGYEDTGNVISHLVDFHHEWSTHPKISEDVHCFTIREIAATVKALSDGESIFDAIMTIYGARYQHDIQKLLIEVFQHHFSIPVHLQAFEYPGTFPRCFHNASLSSALKSIIFSFKNNQHVILTGKQGNGKTQLARWISEWHSMEFTDDDVHSCDYFCVCTEETKCSDLIGRQRLPETTELSNELIKWENGFLTKAIIEGRCAVLDNLDEAPATVSERLNGLLDQKYDGKPEMFDLPESPSQKQVEIKPSFRLLCTCDIEKLHNISPAFLNRFDIVVLEDQLFGLDENQLKDLVILLMNRYGTTHAQVQNTMEQSDEVDSDFYELFGDEEEEEFSEIKIVESEFIPSNSLVSLVLENLHGANLSLTSRICKAIVTYTNIMPAEEGFDEKEIVQFSIDMILGDSNFPISDKIQNKLRSLFRSMPTNKDSQFFYEESGTLVTFMCKLMAASLINQHVCVYGPTGVGKTSAARVFSRIRHCLKDSSNFQMHSFHSGTKPNNFYGTTTIKGGKIFFRNGTLTTAMKNGETFIADEMNLSTASTMKSLAPALESTFGGSIFIPGIDVPVVVQPDFFFIACQNDLGTIGRNAVPLSIASRFRFFDYPKQTEADIEKICIKVFKSNYSERDIDQFSSYDEKQAEMTGRFMIQLNKLKQNYIPQWSLRDISKIFRRVYGMRRFTERFLNFEIYHHVIFYTLSPVSEENLELILQEVVNLISSTFDLDENSKYDLINCYKSRPEIRSFEGRGAFIMKGNIGISYKYILDRLMGSNEKFESFNLYSLWDLIFKVMLSDSSEPILLMGPSSFKTFLAKLFLTDSSPITLNQESTIAQLLGSSGFFSPSEAKMFYLEYICKICHSFDHFHQLKEKWEKGKLERSDIDEIIGSKLILIPKSFITALNRLIDKLFEEESDKNCVLSNIILEFRPGVFLNAILGQKSLILKNLSNLPTIVLERFNELLSGKQNLTLNEDIHNTFTSERNKELTDFNSSFRVMATCSSSSLSKLSETILSRFTVIAVPEYQLEEQKYVLESYVYINQLSFDQCHIENLIKLAENFNKGKITFSQMIKAIELCSLLNQESGNTNQLKDLSVVSYRLFGGLLTSRKSKQELQSIISAQIHKLPANMCECHGDPISVEEQDSFQGIKSNMSEYFIKSPKARNPGYNVAFIPIFNEMVDVLHLGIMIHNPVILEGSPGQGKQLAIKFIAESLGYEVVNIIISESTKVEDLLGKVSVHNDSQGNIHVEMIKTKLVKALKSENESSNTIIVFQNLNNASPAVLNVLDNIFATDREKVTLTDGSIINKGKLNVVGIFNSQSGFSMRDKLPTSLIISSIYYVVRNPNNQDIGSIIETVFSPTKFRNDMTSFASKFKETKKICSNSNTSVMITVNDIIKYVTLREVTLNIFDESTISQIIFAYRFPQEEMIQLVLKTLNLNTMKLNPQFTFNTLAKEVYIQISSESKTGMRLPIYSDIQTENIEMMINCLTVPQKQSMIFLTCSVLFNRACLIQGGTASGKSHCVRLFSSMLGKKLFTYQMNSETGISILSGQSILENKLSSDDISIFNKSFNKLKVNATLSNWISTHFESIAPDQWTPQMFNDLIHQIDEVLQKEQLNENVHDVIVKLKDRINQTKNPAKRFHHVESSFIKAMTDGHWVLIDGIESAPSSISEKLSSLCGDDPELNLFECGQNFFFSRRDVIGSRPIHKDFRLFVTFNPITQNEHKVLDHSFMNKCLTFTLPPIDSTIEYSAQVLLGSLVQSSYHTDLSVEIGARMAKMHTFAKKESEQDQDSFAGDLKYTGRTLKFVTKSFSNHIKRNIGELNIYKPICQSIRSYYWNSYINNDKKDHFNQTTIDELCEEPSNELLTVLNSNKMSLKERNLSILNDLLLVQRYVTGECECSFNFSSFIEKSKLIKINDLLYIYKHLSDTIQIIKSRCKYDDMSVANTFEIFGCLKSIRRIFKNIIKHSDSLKAEQSTLLISDPDLFTCDSLKEPLAQFHLLSELMKDIPFSFINQLPIFIVNPVLFNLLKIIIKLTKERNYESFISLIECFHQYPKFIALADKIFPYSQFYGKEYEILCYLIPLLVTIDETQTNCCIKSLNKEINFKYDASDNLSIVLVINPETLLLGTGTYLQRRKKKILPVKDRDQLKDQSLDKFKTNIYAFCIVYGMICQNKQKEKYDYKKEAKMIYKNPSSFLKNKLRYSSSSLLYQDPPKSNMIAKIWSFAFFMSTDDILVILDYLHPIESNILQAILTFKTNLIPKHIPHIINFTKCIHNFGNSDSILWKVIIGLDVESDCKNKADFQTKLSLIEEEIAQLQAIPTFKKDTWAKNHFISTLEQTLLQIRSRIIDFNAQDEEKKYAKLYHEMMEHVKKQHSAQKDYQNIQKQIINHLLFLTESKENLNQVCYDSMKRKVDNFLQIIQKTGNSSSASAIQWPSHRSTQNPQGKVSDNQKIFEILIWFSQMHHLLDTIIEDEFNPMESIIELSKHQEMNNITELLLNITMRNNNMRIREFPKDIDIIYSTLNANFLHKIFEIKCFGMVTKLSEILNKYMNREMVPLCEYQWSHDKVRSYPIDFQLIIPQFRPNDLIFLFTNKNGQSSDCYKCGPLTTTLPKIDSFHRSLIDIMSLQFNSFKECAMKIGQEAFRVFVDPQKQTPEDEKELIESLKPKDKKDQSILNIIINMIKSSEALDYIENIDFSFDDGAFLEHKSFEESDLVTRFPSLAFWLVKNHQCWQQLQSLSLESTLSENKLPFWLHCLRIMSSKNCIKFETDSNSITSQTASLEIESSILKYIESNQIIDYEWINLLMSDVPNEFIVPKLRIIFTFLNYLTQDNMRTPEFIQKFKTNTVKDFVNGIVDSYFSSQLSDIYKKELESQDAIIEFIRNPLICIQKLIKNNLDQDFDNFIRSEKFRKFSKTCEKIKEDLPKIACNLENKLKEEKEKILQEKIKQEKKNIEDRKEKAIQDIMIDIQRYLDLTPQFETEEIRRDEFEPYAKDYCKLYNQLQQYKIPFFTNEKTKTLILFKSKSRPSRDFTLTIKNKHGNFAKRPFEFKQNEIIHFYFPTSLYTLDCFKTMKLEPNKCLNDYNILKLIFFSIKNDAKDILSEFIEKQETKETQYQLQTIYFGQRRITDTEFLKKICDNIDFVDGFNTIQAKFENHVVDSQTLQCLTRVSENISILTKNCYIETHNQPQLAEVPAILRQNLKPLLDQLENDMKPIIHEINLYHRNIELMKEKMFTYDYSIKRINMTPSRSITPQFSQVKNIDLLLSPIISVSDNNEISCCSKSIHCSIGPLNPALYSKAVVVNILSFIEEDLSCEIQFEKYNEAFYVSETVKPGELMKIFLNLSMISIEEVIEEEINGQLVIESNSYQPLTLPVLFNLKLIPNDILLICNDYKLSYLDGNYRLNAEKIISESTIQLQIKNYRANDLIGCSLILSNLEENDCDSPKISENKNQGTIILSIPAVDKVRHLSCILEIFYSPRASIKVMIDAVVIPFEFKFEVYDFKEKTFNDKSVTIYSHNNKKITQFPLYFRTTYPSLSHSVEVAITKQLPYDMKLIDNKIGDKLTITKEINDFKLIFDHSTVRSFPPNSCFVAIKIGSKERKIYLKFSDAPYLFRGDGKFSKDVKAFPTYMYHKDNKDFIKVTERMTFDKNDKPTIVSIFDIMIKNYTNRKVNYNRYLIEMNPYDYRDQYKFLQINKEGNYWNDSCPIDGQYCTVFGFHPNQEAAEWVPAFNSYPKEQMINWSILLIDEENFEISKTQFDEVLHDFNPQYNSVPRDFKTFIYLFSLQKVIKNIEKLIDQFPIFIKSFFTDHMEFIIPNQGDSEKLLMIRSHNFITKAYQLFVQRYDQIVSNGFYLCPQNEAEIAQTIMKKAFDEYHTFPYENGKLGTKLRNEEEEIRKIHLLPLPPPEEFTHCYLIEEKSTNNPKPSNDKQDIYRFNSNENKSNSNIEHFHVELPNIEVPAKPTIQSLIKFYKSCQNATRILPLYIIELKLANQKMSYAELYFSELLSVYESHEGKDRSFISSHVNSFVESFQQMINRLRKAEIKFTGRLASRIPTDVNESGQYFIEMPEQDQIKKQQIIWRSQHYEEQPQQNYKIPEHFNQPRHDLLDHFIHESPFPDISIFENKENERDPEISHHTVPSYANNHIEASKAIIAALYDEMTNEEEEEETTDSYTEEEDEFSLGEKKNVTRVLSGKETTHRITPEKFDEIKPTMSEEDGIRRAIQRMRTINKNQIVQINELRENLIPSHLLTPNKDSFPVRELIDKSLYLASLFISSASDKMVPFNNIAANIMIDCSSYIGGHSKLFNMMVASAMIYALNAIEIPYSVALTSDNNFICVIKRFEESHSIQVLQRILDCVLIKRFRTKIANSLTYAMKYMRHPDKSRNHHAIFTLTDGLDENLLLTKSFAESIFNQKENSFGFIFIKSSQLEGENLSFLDSVWDNFELETKSFGAKSNIKVATMIAEINEDSYRKFSDLFSSVLKRSLDQHPDSSINHSVPEFPDILPQLGTDQKNDFISLIDEKFDYRQVFIHHEIIPIVVNTFDKLDTSLYRGKLSKVCNCLYVDQNFNQQFILNKRFIPQEKLHSIFHPNKASQTVLSSTGTEYDITALVLNIINPMPDPLIYLEEKGGLIRNYGVTVVIDSSFSCFNEFSASHSIQTIRALLCSLASLSLPCFDVIIATEDQPKILCSEIETSRALKENSPLWNSILTSVSTPCHSSNLASAIHAAFDLRRMRSTEYNSFLFVLTDGLFQANESKRVLKYVNMCIHCGINTFGVGIGIYPVGIKDIFSQAVFAPNPLMLVKAISYFFGDDLPDTMEEIRAITYPIPDNNILKSVFNMLIDNEKSPTFVDLKRYLESIQTDIDAFDEFINKEQKIKNESNEFINPDGANTEMYVRDMLKGQKILIVMLWTNEMNEDENAFINPRFISNRPSNKNECIATCIEHYGIEHKVVLSYKDAINELCKQTRPGLCDYYAVWVLNGPQYPILPPNGTQESVGAHLVGQFIDCLLAFWNHGGSVVLFNDGSGLCYQTNLFLEKVRFQEKQGLVPAKLRLDDSIENEHPGKKVLLGDDTGLLISRGTFNRKNPKTETFEKLSLSHNLGKIFEGVTITFAMDERQIYTFTPFSRDSSGGISTLFYPMVSLDGPGNIIIDCGYTKLFMNMETDGTARYAQNIAGWTANVELVLRMGRGIRPCDWRPKAVAFHINEGVRWNGFKQLAVANPIDKKNLRTIFAIDNSGSVGGKDLYHDKCRKIIDGIYKNGDRIFIWGSCHKEVIYSEMNYLIIQRKAECNGTRSELIADILLRTTVNEREHLVIITDGLVDTSSIDESDRRMQSNGITLKHVTSYVIGSGANTSVGIPYCRGSTYEAYEIRYAGEKEPIVAVRQEDLNRYNNMRNVSTYQQFLSHYSSFSVIIYSKTAGKGADNAIMRDLSAMKARIEATGNYYCNEFNEKYNSLYSMASGGIRNMTAVAAALTK